MTSVSEKIELLGKGLYTDIPDVLTIHSIPTSSELEYVSSEDFDTTMVEKILPQAIEEDIDPKHLLEIDYQWILRCLRILNYGPYYTTTAIICPDCGVSYGEYTVDLQTIQCKPIPEGFTNDVVISKDEFLDYDGDIHLKLLTIQDVLNIDKDKAFLLPNGEVNTKLARLSYMITSMKNSKNMTPIEIKMKIVKDLSPADYEVLKYVATEQMDFGLRAAGSAQCPKCGNKEAGFLGLVNDKFFRPTLGDLRQWKSDRNSRKDENSAGNKKADV